MTVSTTNSSVSYTGNGSTTSFSVTFEFLDSTEVKVYKRVIATGVETLQSISTHYTLSGGNGTTGAVAFGSPPADTEQVHIIRETTRTQPNDFTPSQRFPSASVERGLDRCVMAAQDTDSDTTNRALMIPKTDPAAGAVLPASVVRANKVLAFDAAGVPTMIDKEQLTGYSTLATFTSTDATPSVANKYLFKTANAGSTTITAFDDGQVGQVIRVIIADGNTTIDFTGTTLKGNQGSNWSPANGDHMTCVFDGTNWYCDVSDDTA